MNYIYSTNQGTNRNFVSIVVLMLSLSDNMRQPNKKKVIKNKFKFGEIFRYFGSFLINDYKRRSIKNMKNWKVANGCTGDSSCDLRSTRLELSDPLILSFNYFKSSRLIIHHRWPIFILLRNSLTKVKKKKEGSEITKIKNKNENKTKIKK